MRQAFDIQLMFVAKMSLFPVFRLLTITMLSRVSLGYSASFPSLALSRLVISSDADFMTSLFPSYTSTQWGQFYSEGSSSLAQLSAPRRQWMMGSGAHTCRSS